MALIMKKFWESMMSRSATDSSADELESTGTFSLIPEDILTHVFKLLGPREAARACSVCRAWRQVSSDNTLWMFFLQYGTEFWETVIFSETYLRPGRHKLSGSSQGRDSMFYFTSSPQLSYLQLYGQREKVPGSVIIDGGSGYCKYGWSKYSAPSGRCATFLEFGNIESPIYQRLLHFFSTIFTRMQVKRSSQPVVVSLPTCLSDDTETARASRKELRLAICTVLFKLSVPAVCAIDQSVLGLYAARRTSGIVVNIGFNVTTVVPIFGGKVMREVGIEVIGLGALKLTGFLKEQMQQKNMNFQSLYTVRTLKEKLCYVASDYHEELCKDTEASCEVPGEGWYSLSKERFQTGEILFQPQIAGIIAMGLQNAVSLCFYHCADADVIGDDEWFKTVVLVGGTSCLPGLTERLEKELINLLPPSLSKGIKVLPPPYGVDSAWFGAKIVSNVSSFPDAWCITKKEFRKKHGQRAMVRSR